MHLRLRFFEGNPAGVCITDTELPDDVMFSIAKEMAVSETAFLSRSTMRLRWFTPEVEVKLCGHGTLSVVHVLVEEGELKEGDTVTFNTLSGSLYATVSKSCIELLFPAPNLLIEKQVDIALLESLGLDQKHVVSIGRFDSKLLIEVTSENIVQNLSPNFDSMKKIPGRGVVVTSVSDNKSLDFVSRYFAPWVGVNEDPVTGSAHCALGLFWGDKLAKTELKAFQASKRGGYVDITLLSDNRIKLKGQAVTALKGCMHINMI